MRVHFVSLEGIDSNLTKRIAADVGVVLGVSVSVASSTLSLPPAAYHRRRKQYLAAQLLHEIEKGRPSADTHVLALTDVDLYAPGLNFVFGQADTASRLAIISLARLREEFWGRPPDQALLLERAIKEAVHEVGHALGLGHCSNPSCVMYFSNQLSDTDHKGKHFCVRCARALTTALEMTSSQKKPQADRIWEPKV